MRCNMLLAAMLTAATVLPLAPLAAQAGPTVVAQPLPLASGAPAIELTAGGCGFGFHRDFYGYCRPNGWGWHRWGWHHWGWHRWHHWHRWY